MNLLKKIFILISLLFISNITLANVDKPIVTTIRVSCDNNTGISTIIVTRASFSKTYRTKDSGNLTIPLYNGNFRKYIIKKCHSLKPSIEIKKYSGNFNDLDWDKNHNFSDDSQKIIKNSSAVFKIKVTNNWKAPLKDVVVTDEKTNSCNKTIWDLAINQSIVYTCKKDNVSNFFINEAIVTWKNKNTNENVSAKDSTTVIINNAWFWKSLAKCTSIKINKNSNYSDWIDVTCTASHNNRNFRITCWEDFNWNKVYITWKWIWTEFNWICAYWLKKTNIKCEVADFWKKIYKTSVKCVNKTKIISPTKNTIKCWDWIVDKPSEECDDWNTISWDWCSNTCKKENDEITKNNVCWDGIIWERSNNNEIIDECDFGINLKWPKWCTSNCKIDFKSIPSGWELQIFFPEINKITWDWIKLFWNKLLGIEKVILKNTWIRTLAFEDKKLCLNKVNSPLYPIDVIKNFSSTDYCIEIPDFLQPGREVKLDLNSKNPETTIENLVKNDSNDFWDVEIIATINNFNDTYFAKISRIRVAKPWISTIGAWNTKYNKTEATADIWWITEWNDNNFVGWNIWNVSSRTESSNEVTTSNSTVNINTNNATHSWNSYNGLDNVFIIDTIDDLNLNTNINWTKLKDLTEATTLIIKNNATITGDIKNINFSNIAIVVKKGDLKIDSNVTNLEWTFIVIDWNIIWDGNKIDTQLIVKGSLYWDINGLISERTYVDWDLDSNESLNIWTMLDFDSNMYSKPAPLLSDFLSEYTNTNRIAR